MGTTFKSSLSAIAIEEALLYSRTRIQNEYGVSTTPTTSISTTLASAGSQVIITITDYNPLNKYNAVVTHGEVSILADKITWYIPAVSSDTYATISVYSNEPGDLVASVPVVSNLTITNTPVEGDETLLYFNASMGEFTSLTDISIINSKLTTELNRSLNITGLNTITSDKALSVNDIISVDEEKYEILSTSETESTNLVENATKNGERNILAFSDRGSVGWGANSGEIYVEDNGNSGVQKLSLVSEGNPSAWGNNLLYPNPYGYTIGGPYIFYNNGEIFVVGNGPNGFIVVHLTTAYDPTTKLNNYDFSGGNSVKGFIIYNEGLNFATYDSNGIHTYSMSSAYVPNGSTLLSSFPAPVAYNLTNAVAFSKDGRLLIVHNTSTNILEQYQTAAPFDYSNITLVSSLDVSSLGATTFISMTISPDSRYLLCMDYSSIVMSFDLTSFSVDNVTQITSTTPNVSGEIFQAELLTKTATSNIINQDVGQTNFAGLNDISIEMEINNIMVSSLINNVTVNVKPYDGDYVYVTSENFSGKLLVSGVVDLGGTWSLDTSSVTKGDIPTSVHFMDDYFSIDFGNGEIPFQNPVDVVTSSSPHNPILVTRTYNNLYDSVGGQTAIVKAKLFGSKSISKIYAIITKLLP